MNDKILKVYEFDTIIGNSDYADSPKYKYLKKKHFDELMTFAKEYSAAENDVDALEFMHIGYKTGVRDIISVRNYVGLIELPSGFQIEILPKVQYRDKTDEYDRTKAVFLKMLRYLTDFEGKDFSYASLNADKMNLYEIFIRMYIQEVLKLTKRGLKSAYTSVEENLGFYKGKLIVPHHIRTNLTHKERFYVEHDEYSLDRAENRLIKSTLLKLQGVSHSDDNKRLIKRLLLSFEFIPESYNYDKDFSAVVNDRSMKGYDDLMLWSRIFLSDKSITTFSGSSKGKSILFPMESVFEEYVGKNVRRVFSKHGWNVSLQDSRFSLFDYPQKRFKLRPDIVLRRGNDLVIMDTKWKVLNTDRRQNYGISQADMYQMYAYAKKYTEGLNIPEIWLLYPRTNISEQIGERELRSDDGVIVHISFIDLSSDLISEIGKIRRKIEFPEGGHSWPKL